MPGEPASERAEMVARQLRRRGITDERVLAAMAEVPRERFVLSDDRDLAYADRALALDCGQTISQPWIVAAICQALELEPGDRVLEIGTGSGYSTAVLSRLATTVISVERIEQLAERARRTLAELDVEAVVRVGDGSAGAADQAPFEAIAIHATLPAAPAALLDQLAPGGRLVAPIATAGEEVLTRFRAGEDGEGGERSYPSEPLAPCRFVPLIGEAGYPDA